VQQKFRTVYELSPSYIHQLYHLYRREWWTKDRTLEQTEKVLKHSQVIVGLLNEADELVGFARVLTDFTFKALIFDLIVKEEYREQGLGRRLLEAIFLHEALRDVRHFELYCLEEMVPYYRRFGFSEEMGKLVFLRRERG